MGRPNKPRVDEIVDYFMSLPVERQDGVLLTLEQIHRISKRRCAPEPEVAELPTEEDELEERRRMA